MLSRESREAALNLEADLLCRRVESDHAAFRKGNGGRSTGRDGARIRLVQADRNLVYRIRRQFSWYLKMPNHANSDVITRESCGAATLQRRIGDHPGYQAPAMTRFSMEDSYMLATEVPGRKLNHVLFAACLLPSRMRRHQLAAAFRHLGEVIGRLHQTNASNATIPKANRDIAASFSTECQNIHGRDLLTTRIVEWMASQTWSTTADSFIHGNLKLENVIVNGGNICLLDFENSGHGVIYIDLSWAVTTIVLTKSLVIFPWKSALHAAALMLAGYRQCHEYSEQTLLQYVAVRVCKYYMDACDPRWCSPRISGIPVSRRKLTSLVNSLISDGPPDLLLRILEGDKSREHDLS
jgi:aminoglycoside phosphotransferase (APT) family kinase protein